MEHPSADAPRWPHDRDPQNFTSADKLAWRVVAYCAAGFTVLGTTAAIIGFAVAANG
ncbi:hypothetical protein [Agrococcus sp. Marseille-P2731]|uniref:hypothetical protein n=1 Tax=Agrococcus sp. Marseille-P2731 TaxID=1841862 RepID=UPI0013563AEE|nr:hypothetical protein [Agrococcus sp. Marseille-P2731]